MQKLLYSMLLVATLFSCGGNSQEGSNTKPHSMLTTKIDGKALFQANCAACHNPIKDAVGPALKGSMSRVPSKEWLYNWVQNPNELLAKNDPYSLAIFKKWNQTMMTANPNLSHEEIDAIMQYVEE